MVDKKDRPWYDVCVRERTTLYYGRMIINDGEHDGKYG